MLPGPGAGAALPPLARRQRRAARRPRRGRAAAAGGELPRLPVVGRDDEADDRGGDPRQGPRRGRRGGRRGDVGQPDDDPGRPAAGRPVHAREPEIRRPEGSRSVDHEQARLHESELPAHTPGTPRGEELVREARPRAGPRRTRTHGRTARDATSINPDGPRADRPADAPPAARREVAHRRWSPRSRVHDDGARDLTALASIRRFMRPRACREHCELCDAELADEHPHLVELATRRLVCAATACAILFDGQAADAVPPRPPARPVPARLPADRRGVGGPATADQPGLLPPQHARPGGSSPSTRARRGPTESLVAAEAWEASRRRTRSCATSSRTSRGCW